MSKNAVLVSVEADRKYSTNDRLIRRFIKLCKQERIREEYKEKMYFKTKSQKKREKSSRARRRIAKDEQKELNKKNQQKIKL